MIFHKLPYNRIVGWFDYHQIYDLAVRTAKPGDHFVELGSFAGRSATYMAMQIKKSGKMITFDCIDHWWWGDPPHVDRLPTFLRNIRSTGLMDYINPIQMYSAEAKDLYLDHSLSMVFIDADHEYPSVLADLQFWYPKVRVGGIIAGHDYDYSGVKQAVDEFFGHRPVMTRSGSLAKSWIAVNKP